MTSARPELPIAGVPKTRHDEGVGVEALIHAGRKQSFGETADPDPGDALRGS
jgi:hypothetical protein